VKKTYEGFSSSMAAHDGGVGLKILAKGPDASLAHGPNKKLLLYVPSAFT